MAIDTICRSNERPYHADTLSRFEIDRAEITQSAFVRCVQATTCTTQINIWLVDVDARVACISLLGPGRVS